MSKELEAIQVLKANAILFDDGSDYGASMLEAIEVLDKYLTPPTEQEVCEALSEYFESEVKYSGKSFRIIYSQTIAVIAYMSLGNTIKINFALPPHLVEMIGKFYEGKVEE